MIAPQKGMVAVEFAIVGSVFLVTLLSIIEIGITLMTWNSLSEATRRGARVAVVCPVNDSAIKNIAIFDNALGTEGGVIAGLSAEDIDVTYLDLDGAEILDTAANYIDINFVRVSVNNSYNFSSVLPWLSSLVNAPPFSTTLPRESLGVSRENVQSCSV
jgi:Flp pilus assembly protein TadG